MSEGPQVKLRTEWLSRYLKQREIIHARTIRPELAGTCRELAGRAVVGCFCKGKHIFVEFEGDLFLHNHLLMRGKWRKLDGQQLLDPPDAWLSLYVGPYTIVNLKGQRLSFIARDGVNDQLARLGPDLMADPYPREAIEAALRASRLEIGEALLHQGTVCGIGNVARSEALFLAGVHPGTRACELTEAQLEALLNSMQKVLWESYETGGRWIHRVYHRAFQSCGVCGHTIRRAQPAPSRRKVYFCPICQG